jgi:hypothetical protein
MWFIGIINFCFFLSILKGDAELSHPERTMVVRCCSFRV